MDALKAPAATDLEGQYWRRDEAVDAITLYYTVEEGRTVPQRSLASTERSRGSPSPDLPLKSLLQAAVMSVFVSNEKERPWRCFLCVGKALSLSPEDPHIEDLVQEFYTSGDLSKHFRRKHLSKLQPGDSSHCQVCDMKLKHKMDLQNHALQIYG